MIQITDFEQLRQALSYRQDVDDVLRVVATLVLQSQTDSRIIHQAQQIVGGS